MVEQITRSAPALDISTRLAYSRTRAAYERTMMSWIRTATSLITFGFSVYKFFQFEKPTERKSPGWAARVCADTGQHRLVLAGAGHARTSTKYPNVGRAIRRPYAFSGSIDGGSDLGSRYPGVGRDDFPPIARRFPGDSTHGIPSGNHFLRRNPGISPNLSIRLPAN
jgi:putative membrane protein